MDDNNEEEIPYLAVTQLDLDVRFQLDKFFESCGWYNVFVKNYSKVICGRLNMGMAAQTLLVYKHWNCLVQCQGLVKSIIVLYKCFVSRRG